MASAFGGQRSIQLSYGCVAARLAESAGGGQRELQRAGGRRDGLGIWQRAPA